MNWICKLLKCNEIKKPEVKPVIPKRDRLCAVVVGHNALDAGAVAFNGMSEWEYNYIVAGHLDENKIDTIIRPTRISYSEQCKYVAEQVRENGYKLVICLHFNSYNGKTQGTETLYVNSKDFAGIAQVQLVNNIGFSNRGIKYANRGKQMIESINNAGAECVLVEPFFGDEPSCEGLLNNPKGYAEVINEIFNRAIAYYKL